MPSTMVFDMADSGVKAMVDGWADNTEYEALVKLRTGAGPQRNVAEVTSFEPEETEEASFSEDKPDAKVAKPSDKIPAMKY